MDSYLLDEALNTSELCANRMGESFPATEPRIVDGKMKHDSANGFLYPDSEFQQPLSQRGYLRRGKIRSSSTTLKSTKYRIICK